MAIAIGILAATGQFKAENLDDYVFVGELSLDGSIRGVPGILPMALFIHKETKKSFVVAQDNGKEVALTPVTAYCFASLLKVVEIL